MFALESLALNNETYYNSPRVRSACEFLRSKQKLDGGWGETYMVRWGHLPVTANYRALNLFLYVGVRHWRLHRAPRVSSCSECMGTHVAHLCRLPRT
jgi:hypothetical protein